MDGTSGGGTGSPQRAPDQSGPKTTVLQLAEAHVSLGAYLFFRAWQWRDLPETIDHFRRVVDLEPRFAYAWSCLTVALLAAGDAAAALESFARTPERATGKASWMVDRLWVLAATGRCAEAQMIWRELQRLRASSDICPVELAGCALALGEREAAFTWLETAYAERAGRLVWLHREPRLDPLRDDPRLAALIERVDSPELQAPGSRLQPLTTAPSPRCARGRERRR